MLENSWKERMEKDMRELAVSIKELSTSLTKFIEHSKELRGIELKDIHAQLGDHEERIRNNAKFVYQAMAVIVAILSCSGILITILQK